jgi:hypothetical protein
MHLTIAFLLSSIGHIVSIIPISEGYMPMQDVAYDMLVFFMGQTVAIVAESLVIQEVHDRLMAKRKSEVPATTTLVAVTGRSVGLVGYVWTFSWLIFSGWWFVRPYAKLGVMAWETPVPIVAPVLRLLREVLRRTHIL